MKPMDVYLSHQALLQIEALSLISPGSEGILCGHKKGQRFFVENILSAPGVFSAPPERLHRLQGLLQELFLGFFSFDPQKEKNRGMLCPGLVGKVILDINSRPEKRPSLSALVIDYDGTFRLLPLKIKKEA